MTGEQLVELWFRSLFCGWEFLGENTALTYFLVGAALAAVVCNTIFTSKFIDDVNAIGTGIIYLLVFIMCVLFWGALPAVIVPIYLLVVFFYTLNDLIGKSKTDVRRKK